MKTSYKSLLLLAVISLSACQAGRVTQKSSSGGNQTAVPSGPSTGTINGGNLNSGTEMQAIPNATPAPTVNTATSTAVQTSMNVDLKKTLIFAGLQVLDFLIPSAQAADSYQIYHSSALQSQLANVLGSQFNTLQGTYQNYAATLISYPATPVPASLQTLVSLSFTSSNNQVSSLTLPLVSLFAADAAVITYGTSAFYGIAKINAANSTVTSASLSALTGATVLKVGSGLRIVGGAVATVANRNVATVTFSGTGFLVSTSATTIPASSALKNTLLKPINSAVATAAGLPGSYVSSYALLAYVNSLNKVYGFGYLNLSTGVITSSAASCSSLITQFPGYACNTTITTTSTATATSIQTNN